MNKIYKLVWNKVSCSWVAVSELAKGKKKSSKTTGAILAVSSILTVGQSFAGTLDGATSAATNSVAIGAQAAANGDSSVAVGLSANASGINTVALGASSNASESQSIAIGHSSVANGQYAIAMGLRL